MKKLFTLLFTLISICVSAQQSGSFTVGGDFDKFYPVTFIDGGWDQNIATELEVGRSNVHLNSDWRGALIAKFRFHNTRWGNGARFMDANVFQINNQLSSNTEEFIAGWWDATGNNGNLEAIIWFRGGGTTYYYKSNVTTNPTVYDGTQHPLPFQEINGPGHTYKTSVENYVNSGGLSFEETARFNGVGSNYFAGNLGIGVLNPNEKLSVNGDIRAKEIKVEAANWPDYVFDSGYNLQSLTELEKYLIENRHLPDMPSAKEIETTGQNLGQINLKLLKNVEELALHLIEKDKQLQQQQKMIETQDQRIKKLEDSLTEILKKTGF